MHRGWGSRERRGEGGGRGRGERGEGEEGKGLEDRWGKPCSPELESEMDEYALVHELDRCAHAHEHDAWTDA